MSINPTDAQMAAFAAAGLDTPIHMLNLLKFRDTAFYRDHPDEPARTGREAYALYSKATFPLIEKHGGRVVWHGRPDVLVIGEGEKWDSALIIEYPTGQAFFDMVQSDAYMATHYHRLAAMESMKLIRCEPAS